MTFTVTATEGGAGSGSIAVDLAVVSGQSGTGATATAAALSASITPNGTGSLIFGSILATAGAFTGISGTTILQDLNDAAFLEYGSVRSTGTTTGGTPQTVGVTSSGGAGITASLLEITTSGTLSICPCSPGPVGIASASITSAAFAPPAGSMLVLMAQTNGGAGVSTVAITDTSGLGLNWTESVKDNGAGLGYTGVWTAVIPNTVPTSVFGQSFTPSTTQSNDSSGYTIGMQFTLSQATPLTGIWFYSASGSTNLPTGCAIYNQSTTTIVTGTQNLSPSWSGAAGSGWVKCSYDGSVTLAASTNYKVVILKPPVANVYSTSTANWWISGPGANGLTSGVLTAPNNAGGDGGQDTFTTTGGGTSLAYPASSFNAAQYWIDVEVTAPSVSSLGPAYTASMSSM